MAVLALCGDLCAQAPLRPAIPASSLSPPATPLAPLATPLSPPALRADGPIGIGAAALLPGVAQLVSGRVWQGVVLGLVEAGGLWLYLDARADRRRDRDGYRDLAWSVARGGVEPRVDPAFEYYEDLIHWTRSGAFDAEPGLDGVQPERDPATFNGRQWMLAAEIFLGGDADAAPDQAGYEQALDYYRSRAWTDDFAWDWSVDAAAQDRFAELIDDADASARRASVALGVVVANHLLSAIEAFVAYRLGSLPAQLRVVPDPIHRTPQLRLSVPWSP